jgi:hypothetical protein
MDDHAVPRSRMRRAVSVDGAAMLFVVVQQCCLPMQLKFFVTNISYVRELRVLI